jgi:parallel beta-helix repeat protein
MSSRHGWLVLAFLATAGCGSEDDSPCGAIEVDATGCSVVLQGSADAYESVQTALIEAQSGSDVCFCPGTFGFSREVSLSVPDVTLRGLGASRDDVVLDFATQTVGDDGVTVTSDGFTIEHLSIKNSPGNGIVVSGAEDVVFRDLKVSWDAGSVTANGAYAVYPVQSTRVLIENTEVVGAADAGIYVGQCKQALVRNNLVYGNVAGIEIENTLDAEVVDNDAYDNTAGVLVFVLPNLEQREGARAKVHKNRIYDNNRSNFAESGTIVASVPPGTGVLVLAADDTEVHDNVIENNVSTGVLAVSWDTLKLLLPGAMDDPNTEMYIERLHIHGNTFTGNGTDPQQVAEQLGLASLPDVVWDGVERSDAPPGTDFLCLGSSPPSFLNFGGAAGTTDPSLHSTDTTPHECSLPPLDPVSF